VIQSAARHFAHSRALLLQVWRGLAPLAAYAQATGHSRFTTFESGKVMRRSLFPMDLPPLGNRNAERLLRTSQLRSVRLPPIRSGRVRGGVRDGTGGC
jgi:hypothetical protein